MATTHKIENGKITEILLNGKPVKAGFMRGLRKAQETSYFKIYDIPMIGKNPFSGVTVELTALEATIYYFLLAWYGRYERGLDPEAPVQTYDDVKYGLLDINSDAYYDLID